MKQVAKVVIIADDGKYLLMMRSDHPTFPNDPDLPGGTIEAGEEPLQAMLREVIEEAGIILKPDEVVHKYTGSEYSAHQTVYHLYVARVKQRPEVKISWEHASYEWVSPAVFMKRTSQAKDTFMHMVSDVIGSITQK